ncbi:hypothetical protein B0H12DRAFT_1152841 [Mycena haematopus]|nr:hypothetical protein B0H12DRAFT_1152841 [Mycena haematopus]
MLGWRVASLGYQASTSEETSTRSGSGATSLRAQPTSRIPYEFSRGPSDTSGVQLICAERAVAVPMSRRAQLPFPAVPHVSHKERGDFFVRVEETRHMGGEAHAFHALQGTVHARL